MYTSLYLTIMGETFMDKKKVWDNIQDSSRIVLSIVSLFAMPEMKISVGLSSSAVGVVNRILKNTKILDSKDSIHKIADSQLNHAIEVSMRYTYEKINTDTAQKLFFYMKQRLANQYSFADSEAYEKLVANAAEDMDKYDALYVDRKSIVEISSIFLNRLRAEIDNTNNQQLFNLIVDERLSNLEKISRFCEQQNDVKQFEISKYFNFSTKPYFQGRHDEQQFLKCRIDTGTAHIALWGLGGIGKTEICRKVYQFYVTAQGEHLPINVDRIAFFRYQNSMDLTLVEQLKFDKPLNVNEAINYAWNSLIDICSYYRTLIFIDNVDRTQDEDSGLSRLNDLNATIIITTRIKNYPEFEQIEIQPMNYETNRKIFLAILQSSNIFIKESEEAILKNVIEGLVKNHIAATIFLARTLIGCCWTICELQKNLDHCGFNIPNEAKNTDISREIIKLFPLIHLSESEKNIVEAFSLMPNIELDTKTCFEWLYPDAHIDVHDWKLSDLSIKGWIEQSGYNYVMHPVIAASVRLNSNILFDNHRRLLIQCFCSLDWDGKSNLGDISKNLVRALAIATHFNDINVDCALGFKLGTALMDFCDFSEAIKWLTKSYSAAILYNNDDITNEVYRMLVDALLQSGENEKALYLLLNAVESMPREMQVIMNNSLAIALKRKGINENNYQLLFQAIELLNSTITSVIEIYSENSETMINLLGTLANLYCKVHYFEEAKKTYKKSIEIRKKIYTPNHSKMGIAYFNLSGYFFAIGDYIKARDVSIKSLQILLQTYPRNHKYIQYILTNLETVYFQLKEKMPEVDILIGLEIDEHAWFDE